MTNTAYTLANPVLAASADKASPKMRPAARIGEGRSKRGFASMSPERQKEIARQGGKASHVSGHAHQWTAEEARSAGRKGGITSRRGKSKK